jgi:hypothetical protein
MFPLKNVKKSMNLQCVLKKIYITRPDVRKSHIFLPDFNSVDAALTAPFQWSTTQNNPVAVGTNISKNGGATNYQDTQHLVTIILNDKV